ncbi:hypothetical protein PoB_005291200 [Plakobranchus ocellatus]|uniref:Uncharacterized protein n=1 Tax=Plakobranchus ocellatus TaxID=259542 RepID=A0AAV4C4V2_9GAST|nr:hypothetical protein PoB_005291200 [Plakobranchus ocellatus]
MVLSFSQSPESSRVLQTLTAIKAQKKWFSGSQSPESSRVLQTLTAGKAGSLSEDRERGERSFFLTFNFKISKRFQHRHNYAIASALKENLRMKPASSLKDGDISAPSVTSRGGKAQKKWFSGSQSPESSRVLQTLTAGKAGSLSEDRERGGRRERCDDQCEMERKEEEWEGLPRTR